MSNPGLAVRSVAVALLVAAGSTSLMAAEAGYELRVGTTYSDNLELLPKGFERDAVAAVVGAKLDGMQDTGRLQYNAKADIGYHEYLNRDVDGELMGRANLRGSYELVPDTFSWNAGLGYDQAREDPVRPLAPGNIASQTLLTTGPDFRARLGGAMEAHLTAQYSQLNNASTADSDTLGGRLMLSRSRTPSSSFGLGYSFDDVNYDTPFGLSDGDFQRQEVFAQVKYTGARTRVEFEAGLADVSGPQTSDNGLLLRTRLSRRVTPMLTAFVGFIREYPTSDASTLYSAGGGGTSVPLGYSVISSAPRTSTTGQAGLQMQRPRTQADFTYTHRKDDSLIAGIGERNYDELRASMTRVFTPRARGTLYYSTTEEDFSQFAVKFDEQIAGAGLDISFGRALSLAFHLEHRQRDSNQPTGRYDQFSGGIYLRYGGALGGSSAASSELQ